MNEIGFRLPIVIVLIKAPRAVHRHAGFPIDAVSKSSRRDLLFWCAVIAAVVTFARDAFHATAASVDAIVHDDVGIECAHIVVKRDALLVRPCAFPLAIKPQDADLPVLTSDEFLQLRFHVRLVAVVHSISRWSRVPRSARQVIRMMPIHNRVIEAKAYARIFACSGKFEQWIARRKWR